MNHGVIEQVGTPVEIYREPASVFVADFIGAMSLLPGNAAGTGGVRLGELNVSATVPPGLGDNAEVWICIRPEDVMVRGIADNTPNRLSVTIDELEFLGSFYRGALHSDAVPGIAITADFSINAMRDLRLQAGQSLTVALPPDRVRVFPRPAGA
jgi:iron(III) transport system ATP-binding protein